MIELSTVIVEESWEAVCIPEGIYSATVSSIMQKEIEADGEKINIFEWTFDISDGDEKGTLITDSSSVRFTPKSKAYSWYAAASGVKPAVKDSIDLDTLADKPVQIVVKNSTKVFAGEKTETSRISDVLPPAKAGKK